MGNLLVLIKGFIFSHSHFFKLKVSIWSLEPLTTFVHQRVVSNIDQATLAISTLEHLLIKFLMSNSYENAIQGFTIQIRHNQAIL